MSRIERWQGGDSLLAASCANSDCISKEGPSRSPVSIATDPRRLRSLDGTDEFVKGALGASGEPRHGSDEPPWLSIAVNACPRVDVTGVA